MIQASVVPAAGEGSRLRPLTDDRPKSLVEVGGRPLLAHVLDALDPIDPDRHVVVVGDRGDQIRERFGDRYRETPIGFVEQPEPTGLANAVLQAEPAVEGSFVVCNGDNVFGNGLAGLARTHGRGSTPAVTMLVEETDRETAEQTGVVVTDSDGRVRRTLEKPADPPSTLVSAGALAADPVLFDACAAIDPSDRGEYELPDAVTWLLERGHRVDALHYECRRVNVNEPADLNRAASLVEPSGGG